MRAVSYLRVSTAGQGRSGLGLEAQRSAVAVLAAGRQFMIAAEFVEVESGKNSDRRELARALQLAKLTGAILVIAKLDRLSRNAAFLLTLRDSGVRFMAADMPDANDLTIGIMAVIAQAEREATSKRTTEALAVVKRRLNAVGEHRSRSGRRITRLGNPGGWSQRENANDNAAAVAAVRVLAAVRSRELQPLIEEIRADGASSYGAVAVAMNARGILTPRGAKWHPATVRNMVHRLDAPSLADERVNARPLQPGEET